MRQGDVIEAVIAEARDNGLWLEAEGRKGFVNVTEIDWVVSGLHPRTRFRAGERLRVKVYAVTADLFYASLKALDPRGDPHAGDRLAVGSRHTGVVDSVRAFGVFVRLDSGPIGRMARGQGTDEAPAPGAPVEVEVVSFDPASKKLELQRID